MKLLFATFGQRLFGKRGFTSHNMRVQIFHETWLLNKVNSLNRSDFCIGYSPVNSCKRRYLLREKWNCLRVVNERTVGQHDNSETSLKFVCRAGRKGFPENDPSNLVPPEFDWESSRDTSKNEQLQKIVEIQKKMGKLGIQVSIPSTLFFIQHSHFPIHLIAR